MRWRETALESLSAGAPTQQPHLGARTRGPHCCTATASLGTAPRSQAGGHAPHSNAGPTLPPSSQQILINSFLPLHAHTAKLEAHGQSMPRITRGEAHNRHLARETSLSALSPHTLPRRWMPKRFKATEPWPPRAGPAKEMHAPAPGTTRLGLGGRHACFQTPFKPSSRPGLAYAFGPRGVANGRRQVAHGVATTQAEATWQAMPPRR